MAFDGPLLIGVHSARVALAQGVSAAVVVAELIVLFGISEREANDAVDSARAHLATAAAS
ncbi:MAG TPA: hypothetical protein VFZ83_01530, partial [Acidimicrobiia bacterium]|nr:hypothetical protein [Acidimicrobiia bacterium]